MQGEDRGFTDVLTVTFPTAKGFEAERDRSAAGLAELITRAKATGRLRPDFAHQDLPLILMANAGVVTGTRDAAPDAWRRLVGYLLQACEATTAQPLPDPPTQQRMYRVPTISCAVPARGIDGVLDDSGGQQRWLDRFPRPRDGPAPQRSAVWG